MRVLVFLSIFCCLSCNVKDNDNKRYFGDIVETDIEGNIIADQDDQWVPRIDNFYNNPSSESNPETPVFSSYPAYPNPLIESTKITFEITESGKFGFIIYDEPNGLLDTLMYQMMATGRHEIRWDGYTRNYNFDEFTELRNGNYQIELFFESMNDIKHTTNGNIRISKNL